MKHLITNKQISDYVKQLEDDDVPFKQASSVRADNAWQEGDLLANVIVHYHDLPEKAFIETGWSTVQVNLQHKQLHTFELKYDWFSTLFPTLRQRSWANGELTSTQLKQALVPVE